MIVLTDEEGGRQTIEATALKHLAYSSGEIFHIATGRWLMSGDLELARYLDRQVRWVWMDQQPMGPKPSGRGATMCFNAICAALKEYPNGKAR